MAEARIKDEVPEWVVVTLGLWCLGIAFLLWPALGGWLLWTHGESFIPALIIADAVMTPWAVALFLSFWKWR